MPTLLIVDPIDGDNLRALLIARGFEVGIVGSVEDALVGIEQSKPDLVVLDHQTTSQGVVLLPRLQDTPVLVCSHTDTVADRVACLRLGADDFVGKPFDPDELVERVHAILRRAGRQAPPWSLPPKLAVGDLTIDTRGVVVRVRGQRVRVPPTIYRLLVLLMKQYPNVATYEDLAHAMWGTDGMRFTHAAYLHIGRARARMTEAGLTNPIIHTVIGTGYQLVTKEGDST